MSQKKLMIVTTFLLAIFLISPVAFATQESETTLTVQGVLHRPSSGDTTISIPEQLPKTAEVQSETLVWLGICLVCISFIGYLLGRDATNFFGDKNNAIQTIQSSYQSFANYVRNVIKKRALYIKRS
ncbi:LPXTG cell wall anchor domain-containing protein [Enterococcus thailandicus]|uniref:LPXTG cell wall anchor domain-containing protein n=1 Tax=Enterococcus thailandicus TaxID=417368 RepID=UPI0022EBC20E|nr:LPXTG cell wall anchor domain-containing protein [Enterococcus thailandicus]MDA3974570.1 LPXTG cell wall anchor domain-containing protein [Enterococcus thailandicus]MDA3977056.1 LPXTG cell wall anchor domain-containing protein [Enterococcus thailandicus]MDA3982022.1 LPXTG cell wall anchor domain-containing protein [Enterococcus thailandicus]